MLTGMGSLSYGELAGERMRLGLMLNDPEEEHDCFSDNTPASHYNDGLGVQNVYLGRYVRVDGSTVEGPSLSALVAATDHSERPTGLDLQAVGDLVDVFGGFSLAAAFDPLSQNMNSVHGKLFSMLGLMLLFALAGLLFLAALNAPPAPYLGPPALAAVLFVALGALRCAKPSRRRSANSPRG